MALRMHSAPVYSCRSCSESRLVRRNEQRPSARPRSSTRLLSSRVYSMVTENGHQPSTCWLVTGANRGIGLEYVQQLLSQKTNRVAAGFRSDSRELEVLQQEAQDRLLLVKIDVKDESTSKAAATEIERAFGKLDYVINNAGTVGAPGLHFGLGVGEQPEEPLDSLLDAFKINVLGPLCVVRATLDLLMKGSSKTIINVSSTGGCLTGHAQTANPEGPAGKHLVVVNSAGLGYCVTKAGLNMETLVLANQLKPQGFTIVSLTPGMVDTAMGREAERHLKLSAIMKKAPMTPEESVTKQLQIIQGLTPADSGKFINVDGNQLPY